MATVLITGGAGFVGSHLADRLLSLRHRVLVVDDLSTGRLANIEHLLVHPGFHFARASITNELVLDRLGSEADVIVHLAAAVGVKLVVERPVHTIQTNIMGTEAVLKVAHRYGCRVLVASTSEVYGKGARLPFRENDDVLLGATEKSRWGYAASKMVDEFLALAYYREHGLPVVVFRLFNTVGPRQTGHYGMVIPRLMRQAMRDEPITVYGDGTQRRCFGDVADVIDALVKLMEHPQSTGQVFNIGNAREEISILELANRIRTVANSRSEISLVPYAQAYAPGFEDMERRVPDTQKIQTLTGWSPKLSLDATLRRVHQWLLSSEERSLATTPTFVPSEIEVPRIAQIA
ncbi:MAG TPA: NAD-dependent epimerase/dehydratase family protein [Acidobacteriaceae bacterium]|nr:NAD-dependent epimerase/dehydratase family protein [Acidobacteriaceae bacterium]